MKSRHEDKFTLGDNANFAEVMANIKAKRKTAKNRRNKKRRKERKREWREQNKS